MDKGTSKQWFIRQAVEELRWEWRGIIHQRLTEREQSLVSEPMFVVNADMTQWGRWRGGDLRQLELHERLLLEHPWYAVVDVLRHEMAHQLRECLYPNSEEPPHGPLFRQLCERLGANPAASGHYPTIDQQMRQDDAGGEDAPRSALMTRVQKLLTLAERAESHEAEAALAKARSLMAKHDLDESALEGEGNGFVSVCLSQASLRRSTEVGVLGVLLQDFWGVKTLWVSEPFWDANHSQFQRGWNLEISGRLDRVRVAAYVYDYLWRYIERGWNALPKQMRGGQRKRRDYALGVIHGFRTVLERQDAQEDTAAVIKKGEAGLEDYFAARHPSVRAGRRTALKRNQEQYVAGQAAGRKVRIAPGLENGQGSSGPRLLN